MLDGSPMLFFYIPRLNFLELYEGSIAFFSLISVCIAQQCCLRMRKFFFSFLRCAPYGSIFYMTMLMNGTWSGYESSLCVELYIYEKKRGKEKSFEIWNISKGNKLVWSFQYGKMYIYVNGEWGYTFYLVSYTLQLAISVNWNRETKWMAFLIYARMYRAIEMYMTLGTKLHLLPPPNGKNILCIIWGGEGEDVEVQVR